MKKTLVSALTTALVVGAASTTFAAANPFSDVPADHWAYDAVAQLAADGVIEGYGDTTFQGDKNITRYEMAQMVAKAMAKKDVSAADKAMIDKLAAEFSDELNNLGVRVANLEKNADKVKWNGELRYTYHNDQEEHSDSDTRAHNLKFRLEPTAEVNDNWAVHARIDGDMKINEDEDDAQAKLKLAYAEGKYNNLDLRFGKMVLFSDESDGLIVDDEFSGARVQFGNVLKTTLEAGRWSNIKNQTEGTRAYNPAFDDSAADYQGIVFTGEQGKVSGGVAYRHFNSNAFGSFASYSKDNKEDNANIWSAGLGYRFDSNWKLAGAYAQNTEADAFDKAGSVEVNYKGAQNENAGTWGAYAAYRHIGQNVSFAPTYDTFANISNKKGWELGTEYVPFKNVHAYLYYFDGEKLEGNNVDTHSLFGRVSFFF